MVLAVNFLGTTPKAAATKAKIHNPATSNKKASAEQKKYQNEKTVWDGRKYLKSYVW